MNRNTTSRRADDAPNRRPAAPPARRPLRIGRDARLRRHRLLEQELRRERWLEAE